MTISGLILLRIRNAPEKFAVEIEAHVLPSMIFFPENRVVYEILWKYMVQLDGPHTTI
jgi:hypothetical protein